jgi:hypothetical protein
VLHDRVVNPEDVPAMQCTACHIESNDLRSYAHARASGRAECVRLCAACRVLNTLHRRYLPVDDDPARQAQVMATAMATRAGAAHAPHSGA